MRRAGNLFAAAADPANLELAFWKAARGKTAKADVIAFRSRLRSNLARMREELAAGTIHVGGYHYFKVFDPKERLICAAPFPQRVLHHALMNLCEPVFERRLIHDTYACRKGKGREAALGRARHFARTNEWFLKLDIRAFFDSIPHERAVALLERVIKDAEMLGILGRIVRSHEAAPATGLPIGNLTSQHLANLYLGELDHFIKKKLGVKGYVRYMDDFVLWANGKDRLRECLREVTSFLTVRLGLAVKPPQVNRVGAGMPFLGCRLWPDRLALDRRGRTRFRRRLAALETAHARGRLSECSLQQRATALVAHTEASGGHAFRLAVMRRCDFGVAAMDASGSSRVLRGGNWNNNASNCRSANRNNNSPTNTNNNNAFRTVRSSEVSPQRESDSDPASVPSAPARPARQNQNARPGPVGAADAAPSVPDGPISLPYHSR